MNLSAGFIVNQTNTSTELPGEFISRQATSQELPASLCVHLVRVAQNLAAWTEYDSGAFLTHDCNQVDWTDLTRAATDTALTKTDLPSGLGTRFFHRLEANLYAVEETPNGATERVILWAGHLADVSHDFYGQNDFEIVALILHATSVADQYNLELREKGGNSSFMMTTWPNFQSRYIQIYKEGAYIRASVWQTDAYDKGALDDWCEINLSGDLDFDYVSVVMSYGQAGAETSSGYVDPVFGSFEYAKGQFTVRRSDSEDLACSFEVGQGSQDLAASFDTQISLNLGASFEVGQGSLELAGEFISRQSDSEDLPAGFDVNYWYHVSHLVITTGSITAGTVDNTRADDGNDLVLAETGLPANAFDYEFHWLNVPANQVFGIRLNGWYDGNAAHIIKLYEWNFTTPGWDAVTNVADDIPDAVAEQDYVWMAGGPDYVSGGEYRLRVFHISAGNPVHELNVDYLWLDETYAESEDSPPAHFIARQPGSANLLGVFIVRHPASQELGASFDGQVSLNLLAEFSTRRSTQQELPAEFTVNQASRDLLGAFASRQPGYQSLPCKINVIAFLTLPASFSVQNNITLEIPGAFSTRRDADEELSAEFIVRPDTFGDLLAEFTVQWGPTQLDDVIIAEDPDDWINTKISVGTGFLADLQGGPDAQTKVIGGSSYRSRVDYQPDEHDYIKFGHKFEFWMQHDEPRVLYSKYSLCPELEEYFVASPTTDINLCTLSREAMTSTLASVYDLSTAVT